MAALEGRGPVGVADGRCFRVRHGTLHTGATAAGVWRLSNASVERWLATVKAHSWGTFGDADPIRVGVETCADRVFIRTDWQALPRAERPELLQPLVTHRDARRFRGRRGAPPRQILCPYCMAGNRRQAVDLTRYPRTRAYLDAHRPTLERRCYVQRAGRAWYETWGPQDPRAWARPKLVFRDIAAEPAFWLELDPAVVNGDCYWLAARPPRRPAGSDRGAGTRTGSPGLARLRFPFTRNPGVGAPALCGSARGPARGNALGSPRRS